MGDVVTVERKEHKRPWRPLTVSPFNLYAFVSLLTLALRDHVSPKMDAQSHQRWMHSLTKDGCTEDRMRWSAAAYGDLNSQDIEVGELQELPLDAGPARGSETASKCSFN